jgi:hypothetical protein
MRRPACVWVVAGLAALVACSGSGEDGVPATSSVPEPSRPPATTPSPPPTTAAATEAVDFNCPPVQPFGRRPDAQDLCD